jgi:hypothetical protein
MQVHAIAFVSHSFCFYHSTFVGARGSVVATSQKVAGLIPVEVIIFFFYLPNPSIHIMALGSIQSPTEMNTRYLLGGKRRPARKDDNLTTICEPIVSKLFESPCLTILWACTACYRVSFT